MNEKTKKYNNNGSVEITFKVGGHEFRELIQFSEQVNFAAAWSMIHENVIRHTFPKIIEKLHTSLTK